MSEVVTLSHKGFSPATEIGAPKEVWALIIVWSAEEPERIGEVALLPPNKKAWVLGRDPEKPEPAHLPGPADASRDEASAEPVRFQWQRPTGATHAAHPGRAASALKGSMISRRQLLLFPRHDSLVFRSIGRCPSLVNGTLVEEAALVAGDTLHIQDQLLLLCARRPVELQALRSYPAERLPPFGEPDPDGILGESLAIWKLRERIAAYARTAHHVLVIGESGSGKELTAQALHRLSARSSRPLIADNAAALPPSLASALLFGNRRNFPNPGMEERPGLVGAANGSTLFLDEIGDMPKEVQPMFLRVAERGQYMRLGEEGRVQYSDFRLIGATNRPEHLRYELKRRFAREIRVPGLEQRKEDIPLLVRHLLLQLAEEGDTDASAYLKNGHAAVSPYFIESLLHRRYQTHVSELKRLLVAAMAESDGDRITDAITSQVVFREGRSPTHPEPQLRRPRAALPTRELAQQCLDRHQGNIRQAAKELGITRDQLNRMVDREGLHLNRPNKPLSGGEKDR